jgi:hypothetical protein
MGFCVIFCTHNSAGKAPAQVAAAMIAQQIDAAGPVVMLCTVKLVAAKF